MRRVRTKLQIMAIVGVLLVSAAAPVKANPWGQPDPQLSEQTDEVTLAWWKLFLQVFWSRYAMAAN